MEKLDKALKKTIEKYGEEVYEWLEKIIEVEERLEKESNGSYHDWQWHDVSIEPHVLRFLVLKGILKIAYKSRSSTFYELVDRKWAKNVVESWKNAKKVEEVSVATNKTQQVEKEDIRDLFSVISGFDDIKKLFRLALKSKEPVHILLVGPPGCAKTLFLLEVARLKGAYYALGGTSTKSGLLTVLFDQKPKYLLIDEIDKMDTEDFTILLSLMETGIVKETKHNRVREIKLDTRVFAGANSTRPIPKEVLSRFMVLNIPPYTKEELRKVIVDVVVQREGKSREFAEEVARLVVDVLGSRDVRDAIKLARLGETVDEIRDVVKIWRKYRLVSY